MNAVTRTTKYSMRFSLEGVGTCRLLSLRVRDAEDSPEKENSKRHKSHNLNYSQGQNEPRTVSVSIHHKGERDTERHEACRNQSQFRGLSSIIHTFLVSSSKRGSRGCFPR